MAKSTSAERFWSKVDRSGGPDACWPWLGALHNGYGAGSVPGIGSKVAHRVAWILTNGPIAAGLQLDHQCHNRDLSCAGGKTCPHRRCVNPSHVELVTLKENVRRGTPFRRRGTDHYNGARTHCKHGHEFTPENTYWITPRSRRCRICRKASGVRNRERRAAQGQVEIRREGRDMSDSDPQVVILGVGRSFHRDRGDKTAVCNVGGVGRVGWLRKTSWAVFAGYERCRRCWPDEPQAEKDAQ